MPKDENFSTKNERVVLWALICSYHYSGKSSIAVGWSVGQNKSFSKNSKTNFPKIVHEQRVLCQEMKRFRPKMS